MSDLRSPRSKRDWQSCLTAPERKRLKTIDKDLARLLKDIDLLRAERNRIQNRATVRAGK